MPQPKLQARVRRSHDDIAAELAAVEGRVFDAWTEITERLDIETPGSYPKAASTRSDIAQVGQNERFLGYLDAVLGGLRKHDIDVTRRGGSR